MRLALAVAAGVALTASACSTPTASQITPLAPSAKPIESASGNSTELILAHNPPPTPPRATADSGEGLQLIYYNWVVGQKSISRQPEPRLRLPEIFAPGPIQVILGTGVAPSTLEVRLYQSVDPSSGEPLGDPEFFDCLKVDPRCRLDKGSTLALSITPGPRAILLAVYGSWYVPSTIRAGVAGAAPYDTAAWALKLRHPASRMTSSQRPR